MSPQKSEQEKFLVAKMVERVKVLNRENELFGKRLEDPNLSDKDFDLYQGLLDNNLGEQKAYRRMEDNLREWRDTHANNVRTNPDGSIAVCPCGSGQLIGKCDA